MGIRERIYRKINSAFDQMVDDLDQGFRTTISTPQTWEGFENSITYRQNGTIVKGAFRDIIDSGNLLNSQTVVKSYPTAEISWDGNGITPAAQVLLGGISDSGIFVPGRDWVSPTLYSVPINKMFLNNY